LSDLRARGLQAGRGAFGGWDDGDVRLGRLAWYLTRQLRPEFVVETGVARGLTTRIILEAVERNGGGQLWSIDLPPLIAKELSTETAAAVPSSLRRRWTLLTGSSRRRLPELVRRLPRVDLFMHDSMHTTRNVNFELNCVWPSLRPGGAALLDDVERNRATGDFIRSHEDTEGMVCQAEDGKALIAVLLKRAG
jgi:predicted O-methyltransferase YrrM